MIEYQNHGVVVRASVEADITALKNRLREADEKEIIAAGNADGEEVLSQSFTRSSMRYTVDIEGIPVAMFGVVPDTFSRTANVWFLGAPEMSLIKKTFVRMSRYFITKFLAQYPGGIWNLVDCRYEITFRWLESCGAEFNPKTIVLNGVEFRSFIIRGA